MLKTAWKNLFICTFYTGKPNFWHFFDLGVPFSIPTLVIQIIYWVKTKMWYFLESWELVVTDGSCFIALAPAKFGQYSEMRNFSVIFVNFSNMSEIEFSEFCHILNIVMYNKNKGERKKQVQLSQNLWILVLKLTFCMVRSKSWWIMFLFTKIDKFWDNWT